MNPDAIEPADASPRTSRKAVASLILGLLFPLMCLTGIPAIILGILGLREASRSDGRVGGTGLAVAGLVLGILNVLLFVPVAGIGLMLPAVQKVRDAAARQQNLNNLKRMALGFHAYNDSNNGRLPPSAIRDKQGKPLLSWRVAILPYVEEQPLYQQFKLDEPWDGPTNKRLLGQMPKVYKAVDRLDPSGHSTPFRVFVGGGLPFDPSPTALPTGIPRSFPGGMATTFLVVEAEQMVPWTKPDELDYAPGRPLPKLGSPEHDYFLAALADGSVRPFKKNLSDRTMRAAITSGTDGNAIGSDW